MSVQLINKKVYRCQCEWPDCKHKWDADATDDNSKTIDPPARCARCKRYTWKTGVAANVPESKTRQKRAVKLPKPKRVREYEE